MKINETVKGFRVDNIKVADEIKAEVYYLTHVKTGAELVWLKRDDDNKTFAISFKTTPTDDTGVFHILEHSVLNGSQKYPVKEPFVDLIKGSLNTFLNALTFPDKTVYPISSRNNQDFKNMMRVYLDAVFAPLCVVKDNVFRQEGWHYELNDVNDDPLYKGVVYNEMKGAYSSGERLASQAITHYLYPDTCYTYSSGGDPKHIPELTYEKFCENYHKFYNATNARIFLDGDMNIEEVLGIIDDEYLSKMEMQPTRATINYQKPIDAGVVRQEFESNEVEDKAIFSYGYVIGDVKESEKITALNIISSVLTESNQSVLKKAVLDSGLAQDLSIGLEDSVLQPYLEITVNNTNEKDFEKVDEIIKTTLEKVVKEGLDKEEMAAVISRMEFQAKERDFGGYPKGIIYVINALGKWNHDVDPMEGICADYLFKGLREKLNTSYYEDLLNEVILNSKHKVTIISVPNTKLEAQKLMEMQEKMKAYKASLTKEEVEELVKWNKEFSAWQQSVDTPEQKATIPALKLADLDPEPTIIEKTISKINDTTVITYPDVTSGINYVTAMFNIADLTVEELQDLSILVSLLGSLKTTKHDVLTLNKLRSTYLGSLEFSLSFAPISDSEKISSQLLSSFSFLHENENKALEIVKEVMYETLFTDLNEINNIVQQMKNDAEMGFVYWGNSLGTSRVAAMIDEVSACQEYIGGYEMYLKLKKLAEGVDEAYIAKLETLYNKVFTSNRLTVGVTGEDNMQVASDVVEMVNKTTGEVTYLQKPLLPANKEGIKIPSMVSYACLGIKNDVDWNANRGKLQVIRKIVSLDYLWNAVRAMGGAYGVNFTPRKQMFTFASYRDPNPGNALNAYNNTADYLKKFVESDQDLLPYIVGTMGDVDPLLTPKTRHAAGNLEYLCKTTVEKKRSLRQQILQMDKEQIKELISAFEFENEKTNVCVVGPAEVLTSLGEQIKDIKEL